jgi:hypothetical protein
MYLSIVRLQDTLGIHYDDLGLYKELLYLIEAKAWRVNELVILTIHLAKVTKDVIEVLAIDILPSFSNRRHNHVQEIRTSILGKMADSNSVDLLVGLNSRFKRDYGSKTRERENNDTNNHFFDIASALPLVAMLSCWDVYIPLNRLAVLSCRIIVQIGRARVIIDRSLKYVGQCEYTARWHGWMILELEARILQKKCPLACQMSATHNEPNIRYLRPIDDPWTFGALHTTIDVIYGQLHLEVISKFLKLIRKASNFHEFWSEELH